MYRKKIIFDFFLQDHFFIFIFAPLKFRREHSSAGSEHLPYKQRAGGSNPSAPTVKIKALQDYL